MYKINKRVFDITFSAIGILFSSPIVLTALLLVWLYDRNSPIYFAPRIGKDGKSFKMIKIRSMVVNAQNSGVDSTASGDLRITPIGKFVRKFKLDELTQFWNVLLGDMSLVGPRPNVKRDTELYTSEEKNLLSVNPGITDFASIIFSDEGEILAGQLDPDLAYNQLIRPGKSSLGLFYIEARSLRIDFVIIFLTIITIVSRERGLSLTARLLQSLSAPTALVSLATRAAPLMPTPPPGSNEIVKSRDN
jgi:lipopolysaccharide/colanic/teichoic acid biosynthesis glycosyltransferase